MAELTDPKRNPWDDQWSGERVQRPPEIHSLTSQKKRGKLSGGRPQNKLFFPHNVDKSWDSLPQGTRMFVWNDLNQNLKSN